MKTTRIIILVFVFYFSPMAFAHASPDYTKTPVFFVHGHGVNKDVWDTMIADLIASGYPSEFLEAIQLIPDNGANIPAAEEQIAPAIEAFLDSINTFLAANYPNIPLKTKVDLVSYSMGSLSSRWYSAQVRPDRVHKWISLAGANHGTDAACSFPPSDPSRADMCPAYATTEQESFIQFNLNGVPFVADVDETPYGLGDDSSGVTVVPPDQTRRILYVTIRTSPDGLIDPDSSPIIDGAGGVQIPIPADLPATMTSEGNFLMTNGVAHDPMLTDPDTMRLVKIILDVDQTLAAAYSFSEGSGDTVADASGNGNEGTISGASWTTQGRFGTALAFDGIDDWVTILDDISLDLTTGMTLEVWVYPTAALSGWSVVILKERPGGSVYYLAPNSHLDQPATGILIGGGEQTLFGGTVLPVDTWAHLAATYDGATQRLYVNGVEVASRVQTGDIQVSNGPLRIGGNSIYGEYFPGRIDEVRIYNRALTASEIQTDMNIPVVPSRLDVDQKISEFKAGSVAEQEVKSTISEYMGVP